MENSPTLECHNCTCFVLEKGKITSLFSKGIKRTFKKLKNIQCFRFAILETQNIFKKWIPVTHISSGPVAVSLTLLSNYFQLYLMKASNGSIKLKYKFYIRMPILIIIISFQYS